MANNNYIKSFNTKGTINNSGPTVYSVIPNAYNYENPQGLCWSIGAFSIASFYQSESESEYLKLISGMYRDLMGKDSATEKMIRNYKYWVSSASVDASYEFVSGKKASLSILKHTNGLKAYEKSGILAIIGGHTVSITMEADEGGVSLYFNDPYFGQVYKQYVKKGLIQDALKGKENIDNVFSVLDVNNILFARSAIRDEGTLDSSHSLMFLSYLKNEPYNAYMENKLKFSVKNEKVIKYLAEYPQTFFNIEHAMVKRDFDNFVRERGWKMLNAFGDFSENCFYPILSGAKDYLMNALEPVYNRMQTSFKKINSVLDGRYEISENKLDTAMDIKYIKPAHLCIKVADLSSIAKEEYKYFKRLSDEKNKIAPFLDKCADSGSSDGLDEVYQYFDKLKQSDFDKLNKAYYHHIDVMKVAHETCLSGIGDSEWHQDL